MLLFINVKQTELHKDSQINEELLKNNDLDSEVSHLYIYMKEHSENLDSEDDEIPMTNPSIHENVSSISSFDDEDDLATNSKASNIIMSLNRKSSKLDDARRSREKKKMKRARK